MLYHCAYQMGKTIKTHMHINQYADDASLHTLEDITKTPTSQNTNTRNEVILDVVQQAQAATTDAMTFLPLLGGHFNSKVWWSMITWHQCPQTFQRDKSSENYYLQMKQDGQSLNLPFKKTEQASRTIGYRLALTGQALTKIEHQRTEGQKITLQALHGGIPSQDLLRMYFSVMSLGRKFALVPHILTSTQIDSIQATSIPILLRSLHFCRTSNRIFLHGPRRYGCATFKRWSTEILAQQVGRLIEELQNNDRNGAGLQCIMSCIQRDIGSSHPFMTLPFTTWGFLTSNSWVTSIWASFQVQHHPPWRMDLPTPTRKGPTPRGRSLPHAH